MDGKEALLQSTACSLETCTLYLYLAFLLERLGTAYVLNTYAIVLLSVQ